MRHSFSKIRQIIKVESIEELNSILSEIPPIFFNRQFQKSMGIFR